MCSFRFMLLLQAAKDQNRKEIAQPVACACMVDVVLLFNPRIEKIMGWRWGSSNVDISRFRRFVRQHIPDSTPLTTKTLRKKHGYVHSMYSIYCHLSKIDQKHNSPESDSITLVHPSKVRAIFRCPKAIYGYNQNAAEAVIMWEQ